MYFLYLFMKRNEINGERERDVTMTTCVRWWWTIIISSHDVLSWKKKHRIYEAQYSIYILAIIASAKIIHFIRFRLFSWNFTTDHCILLELWVWWLIHNLYITMYVYFIIRIYLLYATLQRGVRIEHFAEFYFGTFILFIYELRFGVNTNRLNSRPKITQINNM